MNTAFLHPDTGAPLSDHFPINVPFDWSLSPALRAEKFVGGWQGKVFNSLAAYPAAHESAATTQVFVKSIAFRAVSSVDKALPIRKRVRDLINAVRSAESD